MSDSNSAQALAERARTALFEHDYASQACGIACVLIAPGTATMTMTIRHDMLNGFGICHGGFISTLADTAMAFASNSRNEMSLATNFSLDFIAPGRLDDVLTAVASEAARTGRQGLYDVRVTSQRAELIALMRGRVHRLRGKTVFEAP